MSYAQKVDEILILLIYGADDTVHFSWEYSDALVNERYTHIVLYNVFRKFHFREKLAWLKKYGRPVKNKELKVIKEDFPLREIDELEKFMQSNRPFCEMAEKLRLFMGEYGVPVD
ncbi:hypothetical protein [Endozoicomonas sp. Mp262]|uniref:hypothetical protein n=1 Tax=Endozoicomonas sp. Mp262 TaxID=2919499 RepID=UPI0021D8F52D